jgi:hypothetical protein
MADLLAFVIPASTKDCVAPLVGTRRLGPYFEAVAERAAERATKRTTKNAAKAAAP